MNSSSQFKPNWYSAPGETIIDILDSQNLSLENFAKKMEVTTKDASNLVKGATSITTDIAYKLEQILGSSAEFWMKREKQYREDKARIESEIWLKSLPIKDMLKFGWIADTNDKLNECLRFFGVQNIDSLKKEYARPAYATLFRTSPTFKSELGSVMVWLRQGEIISSSIKCEDWNEELFEESLNRMKALTRKKNPKDFIPELIKICSNCGVAVAIAPTPTGCTASGVSRFLSPNKALILLSFRYLSDDQFWFTFFHEAGHLLMHRNSNKQIHIDGLQGNLDDEEEKEANLFAAEVLVPHKFQNSLSLLRGKRQIIDFAIQVGVSPGIVIGQMQHLGYADKKNLNAYKRWYSWDDIMEASKIIL